MGDGFELPVRERGASHFAMGGPHRRGPHGTPLRLGTRSRHGRRAPRGAPLHDGRQRQIRGSVPSHSARPPAIGPRGAPPCDPPIAKIRPGENVTLQCLSHDGSPGPRRASRRRRTFANGKIPAARAIHGLINSAAESPQRGPINFSKDSKSKPQGAPIGCRCHGQLWGCCRGLCAIPWTER